MPPGDWSDKPGGLIESVVEHGPVPNPQQPLSHLESDKLWERGKPKKEEGHSAGSACTKIYKEADVNSGKANSTLTQSESTYNSVQLHGCVGDDGVSRVKD